MVKSSKIQKDKINDDILYRVFKWFQKDWIVISICVVCVLICVVTVASINEYQTQINNQWIKQWDSICNNNPTGYKPIAANITFKILGGYNGTT